MAESEKKPLTYNDGLNSRQFQSRKETILKNKLEALLRDDGRGHHHPKFADRLRDDFTLNIVPLSVDEHFTAAVSFELGIIYVGEGLLFSESTFNQMSMLMRHELSHYLMMHEVRMIHELGEDKKELRLSYSLHDILNIIEDFEISNKRYSPEDKLVARRIFLNGQYISGLVTEDHRASWQNLPLEEMYRNIRQELIAARRMIRQSLDSDPNVPTNSPTIASAEARVLGYADLKSPSQIPGASLKDFLSADNPFANKLKSIIGEKKIGWFRKIDEYFDKIPEAQREQKAKEFMDKIADTEFDERINIPEFGASLLTPEEKELVVTALKTYVPSLRNSIPADGKTVVKIRRGQHSQDYRDAYNEIMALNKEGKLSDEALQILMNGLKTGAYSGQSIRQIVDEINARLANKGQAGGD